MARCSSCGHESDLDTYICDNCQYQMQVENIETIPILSSIFSRPDERWFKPDPVYLRLAKAVYKPPYAFRDVNKKKDGWGGRIIRLFCGLLTGLWIVAIFIHIRVPGKTILERTIVILPLFIVFFIFGLLYWRLAFMLYSFLFSLGANFSVQLDGILSIRYNVRMKKNPVRDFLSGQSRLKRQQKGELTLDSIEEEKGLTRINQTGKGKLMMYAYVPFVIANFLSFLVLLIGLPRVDLTTFKISSYNDLSNLMTTLWESRFVWALLDVFQALALLWSAVLMSLAYREIGNANTTKLLIGNLVVVFIIIYTTIFLRPTLDFNLNIIEWLSGL
ncbi:MAG: hypothetical protein ACTSYU_00885 [Promethearchaeota archaeon]